LIQNLVDERGIVPSLALHYEVKSTPLRTIKKSGLGEARDREFNGVDEGQNPVVTLSLM
jgi:hypothetical protein